MKLKTHLLLFNYQLNRLKDKYSNKLSTEKIEFENYLKTINNQIKIIEQLVNEFSEFARMPKPIFKKINLKETILSNIRLMELSNKNVEFDFNCYVDNIFVNGDKEQINRVFINLNKNSLESLNEKSSKTANFSPIISIAIRAKDNLYMFYYYR